MKKIIYILGLSVIFLTACSKDNTNDEKVLNENIFLLKKITNVAFPGSSLTADNVSYLEYNGTKITKWDSNISQSTYTYTGDLLTKIEFYSRGESGILKLIQTQHFTYQGDKVISDIMVYKQDDGGETIHKTLYTYGDDGSISSLTYYTTDNGIEEIIQETTSYFKDGNIIKSVSSSLYDTDKIYKVTATYEYDDKRYALFGIFENNILNKSKNNIVRWTYVTEEITNDVSVISFKSSYTYLYEYNSDGLPAKQEQYDEENGEKIYESHYEYQQVIK